MNEADIDLFDDTPCASRVTFLIMALFAFIGLIASLVLSLEALTLAANPKAKLGCSINDVFDCAAVANSAQSKIFGIPNAFLGMMLQPVLVGYSLAGLSRVSFPRRIAAALNALMIIALGYAHWLLIQSTFIIHALCIWCLTLLSCTLIYTFLLTKWNLSTGVFASNEDTERQHRRWAKSGFFEITLSLWVAIIIVGEVAIWVL